MSHVGAGMRFVTPVMLCTGLLLSLATPAAALDREHLDLYVDARSWGQTYVEACAFVPAEVADPDDVDEWIDLTGDPRLGQLAEALPAVAGLPPADRVADCVIWEDAALQSVVAASTRAVTVSTEGLPALGERLGFAGVRVSVCVPPLQRSLEHDRGTPRAAGERWCEWAGWSIAGTDVTASATFGADDAFLRTRALWAVAPLVLWLLLGLATILFRHALGAHAAERGRPWQASIGGVVLAAIAPFVFWLFVAEGEGFIDAVVLRTSGGAALDRLLFFGPIAVAAGVGCVASVAVWRAAHAHTPAWVPPETRDDAVPPMPKALVGDPPRLVDLIGFLGMVPVGAALLLVGVGADALLPSPWAARGLAAIGVVGLVVRSTVLERLLLRANRAEPVAEPLATELRLALANAGVPVDRVWCSGVMPKDGTGEATPALRVGRDLVVWDVATDLDAAALTALVVQLEPQQPLSWWTWWIALAGASALAAWDGAWTLAAACGAGAALLAALRVIRQRHGLPLSSWAPAADAAVRAHLWGFVHDARVVAAGGPDMAAAAWADREALANALAEAGAALDDVALDRRLEAALARSVQRYPPDQASPRTTPLQPA